MSFINLIGNLVLSLAMSILFFRWVRDSQSACGCSAGDPGTYEARIRRHVFLRGNQD